MNKIEPTLCLLQYCPLYPGTLVLITWQSLANILSTQRFSRVNGKYKHFKSGDSENIFTFAHNAPDIKSHWKILDIENNITNQLATVWLVVGVKNYVLCAANYNNFCGQEVWHNFTYVRPCWNSQHQISKTIFITGF